MKTTRDQNANRVTKDIRREADGTWSRNVWWGSGCVTNVRRQYGYASREAAERGDISEAATCSRCYRGRTRAGRDGKRLCKACRDDLRACDCQNPPPHHDAEGTWHVSVHCPIHGDGQDYDD